MCVLDSVCAVSQHHGSRNCEYVLYARYHVPCFQDGSTALHWATIRQHDVCVQRLVSAGAMVDIQSKVRSQLRAEPFIQYSNQVNIVDWLPYSKTFHGTVVMLMQCKKSSCSYTATVSKEMLDKQMILLVPPYVSPKLIGCAVMSSLCSYFDYLPDHSLLSLCDRLWLSYHRWCCTSAWDNGTVQRGGQEQSCVGRRFHQRGCKHQHQASGTFCSPQMVLSVLNIVL